MTTRTVAALPMDALVLAEHAFGVDDQGLVVIGHPSFDVWSGAMHQASRFVHCAGFVLGDLIVYGENAFGEKASQIIDAAQFSEKKTGVYEWVVRRIPKERRRLELFPRGGFDHHVAVARLAPEEQVEWLEKAAHEDWTVREFREHLRVAKGKKTAVTYMLEVECSSETMREQLKHELQGKGYKCRLK